MAKRKKLRYSPEHIKTKWYVFDVYGMFAIWHQRYNLQDLRSEMLMLETILVIRVSTKGQQKVMLPNVFPISSRKKPFQYTWRYPIRPQVIFVSKMHYMFYLPSSKKNLNCLHYPMFPIPFQVQLSDPFVLFWFIWSKSM